MDLKSLDPAEVKKLAAVFKVIHSLPPSLPPSSSAEDEVVKRLTSQFSAETQTRDDETHMYQ